MLIKAADCNIGLIPRLVPIDFFFFFLNMTFFLFHGKSDDFGLNIRRDKRSITEIPLFLPNMCSNKPSIWLDSNFKLRLSSREQQLESC